MDAQRRSARMRDDAALAARGYDGQECVLCTRASSKRTATSSSNAKVNVVYCYLVEERHLDVLLLALQAVRDGSRNWSHSGKHAGDE